MTIVFTNESWSVLHMDNFLGRLVQICDNIK